MMATITFPSTPGFSVVVDGAVQQSFSAKAEAILWAVEFKKASGFDRTVGVHSNATGALHWGSRASAPKAPKAPKAAPKAKKAPVAYCSECGQPAQPNAAGDGGFVSECCTGNLLKRAPKAPKTTTPGAECSKGRLAKWAVKEGYEMATGPDAVVITTLEGIFAATSSAHITIRWADWSSARLAYGAALAALKQGLV